MVYADYDYYTNVYMGNAVSEDKFDALIKTASARVYDICGGTDGDTECVKLAACAVCDVLAELDGREYIKSESSDGYSVEYSMDEGAYSRRIFEAAKVYLDDEMLYRGIY